MVILPVVRQLLLWLGASAPLGANPPGRAGFADSLASLAWTSEATPARWAARSWTAGAQGSVRAVGHVRQTSADSVAVFEVLVAGQPVWSQPLAAADTIRHGFDVPLYDLAAGAEVGFRLTATTGTARAEVALDILPEPHLARWSPTLPSGYPRWSDEEQRGLRAKGQAILQAIRDASAAKRGTLVIPPGDYLFHADWSRASTLSGIENLEIVANGATFWFEPPMVHALLFEKCRNVTVRGLTLDFVLPCWFQARVTDIDRVAKTLRAAVMPGYEPRNANGVAETSGRRALMFYDADGRFINHRHSPGAWQLADDGRSLTCRDVEVSGIPAALRAGDYVVGTIRTGAALRSVNCSGMCFEDVSIWSSPGMAVNEGGGEGGHVYRRVRATRRPRTNRLQAFGADIFHLAGADRGPTLERCELAYGADDNLNIHGDFGRVVQRGDAQRVNAQRGDAQRYYLQGPYAVGDSVEFREARSLALLGRAKVVTVQPTPDGPSLPIGDRYQAKGEVLVELDQPLELPPLSLVVLDGKRSAAGFVLRGCWLHDNFQRTLINGSPGGVIENNTLQNVGQGLCVQFETWGPWMEGPFARDLVVRGNRFLDAPPDAAAIIVTMHPPGGGSNARRFEARPVTNMAIVGNSFGRSQSAPIVIHNVEGLTIADNSLDYPADAPAPKGLANASGANWLYLQDCAQVTLRGNLTPRAIPGGTAP